LSLLPPPCLSGDTSLSSSWHEIASAVVQSCAPRKSLVHEVHGIVSCATSDFAAASLSAIPFCFVELLHAKPLPHDIVPPVWLFMSHTLSTSNKCPGADEVEITHIFAMWSVIHFFTFPLAPQSNVNTKINSSMWARKMTEEEDSMTTTTATTTNEQQKWIQQRHQKRQRHHKASQSCWQSQETRRTCLQLQWCQTSRHVHHNQKRNRETCWVHPWWWRQRHKGSNRTIGRTKNCKARWSTFVSFTNWSKSLTQKNKKRKRQQLDPPCSKASQSSSSVIFLAHIDELIFVLKTHHVFQDDLESMRSPILWRPIWCKNSNKFHKTVFVWFMHAALDHSVAVWMKAGAKIHELPGTCRAQEIERAMMV